MTGINVIKNCDRIPLSFVIRVGNNPTFTSLSGSIVSQVIMNGTTPCSLFYQALSAMTTTTTLTICEEKESDRRTDQ